MVGKFGKHTPDWPALDRRLFLLGSLQSVLFVGLAARLYHLQVIEGFRYRFLSDKRRLSIRFIEASRGALCDRQGIPLAIQKNQFHAFLLPEKKMSPQALQQVASFLGVPEQEKPLLKTKEKTLLKAKLSWDEVSYLETRREQFPGIRIEVHPVRFYYFPEDFAHVLGYVGLSKEKHKPYQSLYIGKNGLEKTLEKRLQGRHGYKILNMNANHQPLHLVDSLLPIEGEKICLSLHKGIQQFVAQRLSSYPRASAVVLKIDTGEILSLVSQPSFDPHLFSGGLSSSKWKALRDSPHAPLLNRATSGLYPPGSLVKVALGLAALREGFLTSSTTIPCRGVFWLGHHPFHCWHKQGHGDMTLSSALRSSCDLFFYVLATRLPVDLVTECFQQLGLGTSFLGGTFEEKKGLIPTPQWKKESKRGSWSIGDSVLRAIGQGAFLANPLQMAIMMARLASGKAVTPTFFLQKEEPQAFPAIFQEKDLALIRLGLEEAVTHPLGTAYAFRLPEHLPFQMAGKTATSQVRRISLKQRASGVTTSFHLPWASREHTLFAGYAPAHSPKYSLSVVLEHEVKGAPAVARDIFSFMATQGCI